MNGREWTIPAAAGLAVVEAVFLCGVLAVRGSRSAPFFIACVAVKIPFCAFLMRRRAGAWLAVLLWEATGVFAALLAPRLPIALRLAELALAGGVAAFLFACLPLFPRLELPEQ